MKKTGEPLPKEPVPLPVKSLPFVKLTKKTKAHISYVKQSPKRDKE